MLNAHAPARKSQTGTIALYTYGEPAYFVQSILGPLVIVTLTLTSAGITRGWSVQLMLELDQFAARSSLCVPFDVSIVAGSARHPDELATAPYCCRSITAAPTCAAFAASTWAAVIPTFCSSNCLSKFSERMTPVALSSEAAHAA